jgi:L-ascorbate metabolism protein UlaG (beta-lactamase superfamily)
MPLSEHPLTRPLGEILAAPPDTALRLYWLGQAGWVIDGGGRRLVIDPYLSDCLAQKYAGSEHPHIRMMPAPVAPAAIAHVDAVLATHAHTDHLDPGTLPALMATNPDAALIAPAAHAKLAIDRAQIALQRLITLDAGETIALPRAPDIRITATRAAHEDLTRDAVGRYVFLGYAMTLAAACIYHAGDTVPFDGLSAEVAALHPDLALLPVNGRDAVLLAAGIPGNLTLAEAHDLARDAALPAVIAHHFDMFAFNTVPRSHVEALETASPPVLFRAAKTATAFELAPHSTGRRTDRR